MKALHNLWIRYGTPQNAKVLFILLTLAAMAIAGGAPGAGSGMPGN